MKKRFLALITAIVMVFALAACGGKPSLEKLLQSDEWQEELKGWNNQVAGQGITIDTKADGNTLVFEYHLPDNEVFNAMTKDQGAQMSDAFLGVLEASDFLSVFEQGYKIKLDAVRCSVILSDGSELYSGEYK